jgi:hypothetical protein
MGAGFMWMVHSINQVLVYTWCGTVFTGVVSIFSRFGMEQAFSLIVEKFVTLVSFYCSYGAFCSGLTLKIALGIMLGSILWETYRIAMLVCWDKR